MKQAEKSFLSRQKIMESARAEFAQRGYLAGSVNIICAQGGVSKGILYHHFKDKDALYLACMRDCFDALTLFLKKNSQCADGSIEARLQACFSARLHYFSAHPMDQKLFCEASISPPEHLKAQLEEIRAGYDRLNLSILDEILSLAVLRPDVTRREVIETFCQYQDFINTRYRTAGAAQNSAAARERSCERALRILLYGVIAHKGGNENE